MLLVKSTYAVVMLWAITAPTISNAAVIPEANGTSPVKSDALFSGVS
jgi:hypothetical protein